MTNLASKDAAAQQRIIAHMNNDYQDSLIRYLQHYHRLSSFSARNAYLSDITFDSLTILSSNNSPHHIQIKPPMTAWSEARPRLVAMDAEATAALGRSNINVKEYKNPRGFMTVVFVACACTYLAFFRRANFEAGSLLYDMLLKYFPRFANFCWAIQPYLFGFMVVAHSGEAVYMERRYLRKHTVRMGSLVWWKWMVSTFVEGVGSFKRFEEVVREEESRREGPKY